LPDWNEDMLPFTHDDFLEVFRAYNAAIWPAQIVAYALGIAAVILLVSPNPARSRAILAILALMWLWTAIVYHWGFFSAINRVAFLFSALFVLQGALLAWFAFSGQLMVGLRGDVARVLAIGLIAYALLLYPVIGWLAGQRYPSVPVFGVAPCPLVIFTFGLLLLTRPVPLILLIIPTLWSVVGGSAAFLLHVPQDWALLASGLPVVAALLAARRNNAAAA